jgi:hypothetical protein
MAKKHRQRPSPGDLFLVPLSDGTWSLGQVISLEFEALDSILCGFSGQRREGHEFPVLNSTLLPADLISLIFVTPDQLANGNWRIVGRSVPPNIESLLDLSALRRSGFLGVNIIGSANVEKFLNAFHCLFPWNGFYDPNYLDNLLIAPDKKPTNVLLK